MGQGVTRVDDSAPRKTTGPAQLHARGPLHRGLALDRLDLEEVLETQGAALAADTRLLVSTERSGGVECAVVDRYLTGADATSNADGAVGVARPDAAREAERAVVGIVDSAVIDFEAVDVLVGCVVAGGT